MLVVVWEAMEAAIGQISAQEWMDDYTIQVVASPNIDNDARESILESWRRLISGIFTGDGKRVVKEYQKDGTEIQRPILPLAKVIEVLRNAFGRNIRD